MISVYGGVAITIIDKLVDHYINVTDAGPRGRSCHVSNNPIHANPYFINASLHNKGKNDRR